MIKRKSGKAGLILSICIGLSVLSGCNTKEAEVKEMTQDVTESNEQSDTASGLEDNTNEADTNVTDTSGAKTNAMYQIETKEINRNQIKVKYPQLSQDGKDWGEVNQLILNQLEEEEIKETIEESSIQEEALTLELDYKITYQSENIISILYTGNAYIEGGMHPDNLAYGVTIDLSTNKRLYLNDFVDINNAFADQIINADTWKNGVSETDETTAKTINEAISENMRSLGLNYFIGYLIDQSQCNFYITQEGIGIIVQIPHVMGDYGMTELTMLHEIQSGSQYSEFLSTRNENIVCSFKTQKGKTVSVCVDKENQYVIYRYGTKDKVELEFPEMNQECFGQFTYYNDSINENNGNRTQKLQFQNGGYQYEVYKEYNAQSGSDLVGIRVTNLSNSEVTDIPGDASTLIDNWYLLDQNDKIRKQAD